MAQHEELILDVTAKLDQALKDVQALQEQLDALATGTEVTVTTTVQGKEDVEALAATTAELDGTAAEVAVAADDQATDHTRRRPGRRRRHRRCQRRSRVRGRRQRHRRRRGCPDAVDDLDGQTAEVEVEVDTGDAEDGTGRRLGGIDAGLGSDGRWSPSAASPPPDSARSARQSAERHWSGQRTGRGSPGRRWRNRSGLARTVRLRRSLDHATANDDRPGQRHDRRDTGSRRQLGVNCRRCRPLELFVAAIDALNSGQLSATDEVALGIDLFGRRGLNAVNAIGTQIGDLSQAIDNIPEWQVVTEEDISSAIEMKETMDQISDVISEIARRPSPSSARRSKARRSSSSVAEPRCPWSRLSAARSRTAFDPAPSKSQVALFTEEADVIRELSKAIEDNRISSDRVATRSPRDGVIRPRRGSAAAAPASSRRSPDRLPDVWGRRRRRLEESPSRPAPVPRALDEINASLEHLGHTSAAIDQNWRILLKDLEDGAIDTVGAGIAFHNLQTELESDQRGDGCARRPEARRSHGRHRRRREAAAAEALRFAEALADTQDAIDNLNVDDLANIAGDLDTALQIGGIAVDLQVEEASVRAEVDEVAAEIQGFIDEHGAVDWSVVLDPTRRRKGSTPAWPG